MGILPVWAWVLIAAAVLSLIGLGLWKMGVFDKGPKLSKEEAAKYKTGSLGLTDYKKADPPQ